MSYVVICSGGTGGHIFPGCALYDLLKKEGFEVTLLTDERGSVYCKNIEDHLVVDSVKFSFSYALSLLKSFFCLPFMLLKKWRMRRPDVIVGFGGVMTIIPLLVGKLVGAKVIIYEQNAVVGKANKFLSPFADLKLSFFDLNRDLSEFLGGDEDEESDGLPPVKVAAKAEAQKEAGWIVASPPVRSEFFEARKVRYDISDRIKILVIGGSQGAASFSEIIPKALAGLPKEALARIEIIQQVSSEKVDSLYQKYANIGVQADLRPFINNVAHELSAATFVICRSGASTLSELRVVGRPAILIPYSLATDNHQTLNAKIFEHYGAAFVVKENNYVVFNLTKIINRILNNRELLKDASSHIINVLKNDSLDFITFIKKLCENQ